MLSFIGYLIAAVAFALSAVYGVIKLSVSKSIQGLVGMSENFSFTGNTGPVANPLAVPAAQPGTLTTHTTNTTGTATMTNANHGITTGQRIDIFWVGGQCYGAVAGTVSGTTVPIASVSGGSNLPTSGTAITVGISTAVPFNVVGNNLQILVMQSGDANGYFVFNTGSADSYAAFMQKGYIGGWKLNDAGANPLAGVTITTVYVSHMQTSGPSATMTAAAVTT